MSSLYKLNTISRKNKTIFRKNGFTFNKIQNYNYKSHQKGNEQAITAFAKDYSQSFSSIVLKMTFQIRF